MREDMSKVLVESPRVGRANAHAYEGSRRQLRQRLDPDGEGAPQHLGMRRDAVARKHFGEHLGPLFRYLRQQAHRPWDKVYGELCAQLDRRSAVQAHLFQHIGDRVAVETIWLDGAVWTRNWSGLVHIADSRAELFVHPRTGILLPNRARQQARQRQREAHLAAAAQPHAGRRTGLPGMAADCQWHRIDGSWYELKLARLDPAAGPGVAFDVLLKRPVDARHQRLLLDRYGHAQLYASTKRQLARAELRKHGLHSGTDD